MEMPFAFILMQFRDNDILKIWGIPLFQIVCPDVQFFRYQVKIRIIQFLWVNGKSYEIFPFVRPGNGVNLVDGSVYR